MEGLLKMLFPMLVVSLYHTFSNYCLLLALEILSSLMLAFWHSSIGQIVLDIQMINPNNKPIKKILYQNILSNL